MMGQSPEHHKRRSQKNSIEFYPLVLKVMFGFVMIFRQQGHCAKVLLIFVDCLGGLPMVNNLNWLSSEVAKQTLKTIYQQMDLDKQDNIPLIIRLFEDPRSPMALPCKISLHNHDCLHIILGLGVSPQDEAFVIGFTMGNNERTKLWHVQLFKLLSRFIYPPKYRFTLQDCKIFDLGYDYGKKLGYRNLNQVDFEWFYEIKIQNIRDLLGINCQDYIHCLSISSNC